MNALVIAIPVLVLLAAVLLIGATRRRDSGEAVGSLSRETVKRDRAARREAPAAEAPVTGRQHEASTALERRQASTAVEAPATTAPVPWTPPDPETLDASRRHFLNVSIVGVSAFGLAGFGASVVGFLWPESSGGFGGVVGIGSASDVTQRITEGDGFAYYPEARTWVTAYPAAALDKARTVYSDVELAGMEAGFVALYQKCVHLGCRVPQCVTSQWFECPCHGSQYNRVGEKKGGPAPRGLDRWPIEIDGERMAINTQGQPIQGPPIGTNTTGQEAEGPHCISQGGGAH
jgi:cytochrome b6-f complex iron-sulfur subunit